MNVLAKRAVACKGWKWIPGMVDDLGDRIGNGSELADWDGCIPDFTDPATVGCMLKLVLLAHDDPDLWEVGAHPDGGGFVTIYDRTWTGALIPFALVAALEAAPTNR